ncbi:MAG: hypothetical protein ABSH22_16190 [Tepidisphaeraceae bacterium]|jgi:hypothetical protein
MGGPALAIILAQTEGTDQIGQIFVVCLYLFVGVIVLMAGAFWLRRWSRSDSGGSSMGFSPEQLRKLHKEGKMSEEEYKRAKALVTQALKAQFAAPNPANAKSPAKPRPPRQPPIQPPPDAD